MKKNAAGFTLIELLITTGVVMFISAALLSAAVALQRCYAASDDFMIAKCDQMRLSDYLALDLRRALTVTTGTSGNTIVTVAIPNYYDTTGQPRTPTLAAGQTVNYGAAGSTSVNVTYTKSGSSIFRQEGANPALEIAANVTDFQVTVQDLDKVVKTQITFAPQFSRNSGADGRTATTVFNTTLLRNKRRDRS
jgi:Tfp pilus assembly protein PilW